MGFLDRLKKLEPAYLRQFIGLVVGFLGGDWIVSNTKPPQGLWVDAVTIGVLVVGVAFVVRKYPPRSYGRENYKYWMGQLGSWFVGLLIGGFLPLVKSFVYSPDLLTRVILGMWVLALLYLLLLVQEWFQTPKPTKSTRNRL